MAKKKKSTGKKHVRSYTFPSLIAYFDYQRKAYTGPAASRHNETDESRDTHSRLARRMGVSETTITRIVTKQNDPSFALAIAIAQDVDCPVEAMGKNGVA
jgi:DNA-binding XRE family transcriptional regulator